MRTAPAARTAAQVAVELVEPALSEASEFNPHWPLKVSRADLELKAVRERLERRDEAKTHFARHLEHESRGPWSDLARERLEERIDAEVDQPSDAHSTDDLPPATPF